ncbi:MAG: protein-tyrosine phosphatase [Gammaproteobacteria bacterium HGW-Gammaproteobacteria-8]|nr:MAG: protein-tyrosine phosphatase [Gammaproteobacteria bacterium HGW-Gammaproteobacteria-8]
MLTDLHCHMLPGIDDGARDLDQALAMARIARADGISTTVLTPHHLNGVYRNPADAVRSAVANFRLELERAAIDLQILPGSELHLTPELPEQLHSGQALTVGDHGRCALVELPVHTVPIGAGQILETLLAIGITPIIAHPERNSELRRRPELLAEWVRYGCLGQITAQSCIGKFGDAARDAARTMVRAGSIHIIASDAHRDTRRIPEMTPALEVIEHWTSASFAELLLRDVPNAIGRGEKPDLDRFRSTLPTQKPQRWWSGMFGR